MPATSGFANPTRWMAPRWVFIAWLWAGIAYDLLDEFHLVCRNWSAPCQLWSELSWLLGLFPAELAGFAVFLTRQKPLYMAPVVVAGALITWAALRYLPARLSLRTAVFLVVSWYAVTFLASALWVLALAWPYV